MTKELMNIWRRADRIETPDAPGLADELEKKLLNEYLEDKCYIIPEEDWDEIQTRGYDIEMMCADADEAHDEDATWIETVCDSLFEYTSETEPTCLTDFWRGYSAGTEIFDISIPALGIDGECLC